MSRKDADPAARAKRVESRERKVQGGLDELDRWLADLVRRGLNSARSEGYRFWDAMAARLVDAQAPSLARRVVARSQVAGGPGARDLRRVLPRAPSKDSRGAPVACLVFRLVRSTLGLQTSRAELYEKQDDALGHQRGEAVQVNVADTTRSR